jgi:hypothetical protein
MMPSNSEARTAKRRINELEQKLKLLQRELREIKTEKKHVGNLRKQAERAMQVEADCKEVLDEVKMASQPTKINKEGPNSGYRCRNAECIEAGGFYKNTGDCDVIDAGIRWVVVCKDCGRRYSAAKQ